MTTSYKRAGELEKQEVRATSVKMVQVRRKNTRTKPAQKAQRDTRMTRIVLHNRVEEDGKQSGDSLRADGRPQNR